MSRLNLTFFLVLIVAVTLRLGYCDGDDEEPAKTCALGGLPDHLKVKGTCVDVLVGGECEFECEEGFERQGPTDKTKCKLDGTFAVLPTCKAKTCALGRLPDHLKVKGTCEDVTFGGACDFECDVGFYRPGPTGYIKCNKDGKFDVLPTCQAKICQLGRLPDHLKVKGTCVDVLVGGECDFECAVGFERQGPAGKIRCQEDGTFDILPTCIAVTCTFSSTANTKWITGKCTGAQAGDKCTVHCGDSSRLLVGGSVVDGGKQEITCQADGQWNIQVTCQKIKTCLDPREGRSWKEFCAMEGMECVDPIQTNQLEPTCKACPFRMLFNPLTLQCEGYTCQNIKEGSNRTWTDFCSQADGRICVEDAKEGPKCVRRGSCKEDDAVDRPGGKIKIQLRGEIALEAEGGQRVDLLRLLSDLSTGKHLSS